MPRASSLSIELFRTLVVLNRNDGDAMVSAHELGINQPSMSKRLSFLQHAGKMLSRPWVERVGQKWRLTDEGEKKYPAVEEIVRRYRQLLGDDEEEPAALKEVSFACGQTAIGGYARTVAERFLSEMPEVKLRLSTPRSRLRIEGVANGSIDLAEVTHDERSIRSIAHRRLIIWTLPKEEPLVLVAAAHREKDFAWVKRIAETPSDRVIKPKALAKMQAPLLLPEPAAVDRVIFDEAMKAASCLDELHVALETGSWVMLLAYAQAGLGAAVVGESTLGGNGNGFIQRKLCEQCFPPTAARLIVPEARQSR